MVLAITWTGCSGRGAATGGVWGRQTVWWRRLTLPGAAVVLAITWTGCSGRGAATGGGWGGKLSGGSVLALPEGGGGLGEHLDGVLRQGRGDGAA